MHLSSFRLRWQSWCTILNYVSMSCRGQSFSKGWWNRVGLNSGYCGDSSKRWPISHNLYIFLAINLLVLLRLLLQKKFFWWRKLVWFVVMYYLFYIYQKLYLIASLFVYGFVFICYFYFLFFIVIDMFENRSFFGWWGSALSHIFLLFSYGNF